MSIPDIIIVIIAIAAAVWGGWHGIIRQLGSLVAILLGIVACQLFGDEAASILGMQLFTADIILFVAVYFIVSAIARIVKGVAHTLMLGSIDRLGGALFGMFKAMVAVSLVLNLLIALNPGSKAGLGIIAPKVVALVPKLLGYVAVYL